MSTRLVKPVKLKAGEKVSVNTDQLTNTERIFCAEYVANGGNISSAMRIAFPALGERNLTSYATRILAKPRVKRYLGQILYAKLEQSGLTTSRILRHLEVALFLDPWELYEPATTESGVVIPDVYRVRNLIDIPAEIRQCISKIKQRTKHRPDGSMDVYFELEFMSKDNAQALAMKYAGLLKDSGIQINNVNVKAVDYDGLCNPESKTEGNNDTVDAIESRLVREESLLSDKESTTPRLEQGQ